QMRAVPEAARVYRLDPPLAIPAAERKKADALFSQYRREAGARDPVIASDLLFRYARVESLYWYNRLAGRPKPRWILWDAEESPVVNLAVLLRNTAGTD